MMLDNKSEQKWPNYAAGYKKGREGAHLFFVY